MWLDALMACAGLALLIAGGEALVRGASAVALRLGVAPVLVGMTVVAFGTSTPELVVNLAAALRQSTEIGFGNVIGSNIANLGLLLGITALVSPLVIHRTIAVREVPMMILACGIVLLLGAGELVGGEGSGFDRSDGFVLLLLFAVFLYYTVRDALEQRRDAFREAAGQEARRGATTRGAGRSTVLIVGGIGVLAIGGEVTVRGAVGLAAALGAPEVVVGLTLVAVGTSLPELATSLAAVRRGENDLAIGNIVGSNIYNVLFIWGLSTVVAPAALPPGGLVDLLVMTGFSVLLLPMVVHQNRLGRVEGALMILAYLAYLGWLGLR